MLVAAVAVVAVVAVVATFGAGAVLVGAAIGACVGAACAIASTAISDHINGTQSSLGTYAENALKGALTGAVSGAIFGPFGSFSSVGGVMAFGAANGMADSVINQAVEGKFSFKQTLIDGAIGGLTGGLLHGAGKLLKASSPFVKKAFNKISSELSENTRIAKIALSNMQKGPRSVVLGSNLGNLDEALGRFSKEFKKVKNEIKSGTEGAGNPSGEGNYSTEEWYNYLKDKYGEDNVYLCTDEQALIDSVSEKLQNYRIDIDGKVYGKTAVAYGENLDTVSMATSNSHQYNPTILTDAEIFKKNMYNKILEECGDESVAYSKYYEHTLTEDYIRNSLSDESFTSKGLVKDDVISEMKKLTDAIENTKDEARIAGKFSEITGEPSFKEWNVENCAEVWSTRKAILNGAKFDNISFKCVETTSGNYAKPCENCKRTFGNLNNVGKVK